MKRRVKMHALQAAFLHGVFGNRYTKDWVAGARGRRDAGIVSHPYQFIRYGNYARALSGMTAIFA
jgi:hypothetical protein